MDLVFAMLWPIYWTLVFALAAYAIASNPRKVTPPIDTRPSSGPGKNQRGYYNIDLGAFFVFVILIGIVVGIVISLVFPSVWGFIKPLIHSWTA